MARPSWSGFLRFNLISIPVKAFNATSAGGGRVSFHLLHSKCHNRIRYKKVCPVHGEVGNDEIVSGYEVAKGQYVEVEKEERSALKAEDEKTIEIDSFVSPDAVDPLYFSGRSYFLVPDGKVAQKPYAVFHDAMAAEQRYAIATAVFAGRTQVALVRPTGGVLAMSLLAYESELKKPADFEDEVKASAVSAQERKLAETLIASSTAEDFDLAKYKDDYSAKLARLVEGKSRRKVHAPAEEAPAVINLMDALRKSLRQVEHAREGKRAHNGRPRRHGSRRKTG